MRRRATWLLVAAIGAVLVAGVIDSVHGSASRPEATPVGEPGIEPSATTVSIAEPTSETVTRTEAVATEPVETTADTDSAPPEHLPSCDIEQLQLTFTRSGGFAAALLRRVQGPPCRHGRAPVAVSVHDQAGDRVTVFGVSRATPPADFSHGFEQLVEFPAMSCDPNGSFLVVATIDPYTVQRTLPGTYLPCNHG
jgi:hypothetical protein